MPLLRLGSAFSALYFVFLTVHLASAPRGARTKSRFTLPPQRINTVFPPSQAPASLIPGQILILTATPAPRPRNTARLPPDYNKAGQRVFLSAERGDHPQFPGVIPEIANILFPTA
ncbi:hypothetical protein BJY01DRAFT_253375 [Aspergillus pseudoustus]|uniref:Uncharacterized protein n=1 Tax=Aspergillus pseudoustus TaxID=1810923 RepID=A0ABR4J0P6_9EURO